MRRRRAWSARPRRRSRARAAAVRSDAASEGWSAAFSAGVVARGLPWRGEVAVGVEVRVGGEDGGGGGRLAGRVARTVAMAGRGGEDGGVVG